MLVVLGLKPSWVFEEDVQENPEKVVDTWNESPYFYTVHGKNRDDKAWTTNVGNGLVRVWTITTTIQQAPSFFFNLHTN